jgi:FolB domain-containing protein
LDRILITDLIATGILGVKHPERDDPQEILINLTLIRDLHQAGRSDNIADTINYSTAAKSVRAEVAATAFHTVEALAEHLARHLLENFPVEAVTVRVEKPHIVRSAAKVGVEITRTRQDFPPGT